MKREWKETKLASAARAVMGQSPPSSSYNETGDGLPFFQGKADFTSFHPSPSKWCTQPLRLAKKNDILMSVRAPVGDVNMSMESCCIGRGLAALSCNPGTNPYFLYFLLGSLKAEIEKRGTGTTFLSINKNVLEQLEIHLPSLPEQKKIAAVLLKIQRAIETQDRMIQSLRDLKKSTMQHLFTHGLRGEKTKMTEIGEIPESWDVVPCEKIADTVTVGIVVRPASYYVPNGIPAFRSLNVREDRLTTDDLVYISPEVNDTKLAKSKLRAGDVLVVRTGYPGTSCVVPVEYDGANCIDIVIVRPRQSLLSSYFISRFFNSEAGKRHAGAAKTGLAQQHLNVSAVRRARIPVPTLSEQREIAAIGEGMDVKISASVFKKAALQDLLNITLNKLMAGELRVAGLDVDVKEVGV